MVVVLLSFSGRNSLAAYLELRERYERIIPFHMYFIPRLEFVKENLAHYEGILGQKIVRVPHPATFRMLKNRIYQPPNRAKALSRLKFPIYNRDCAIALVRKKANLTTEFTVATGQAYPYFNKEPELNELRPVWNWKATDIEKRIKGIKLGIEHTLFGCSFNGLTYRCLKPISECYPKDMARILQFFPLAEIEIYRKEVLTDFLVGW